MRIVLDIRYRTRSGAASYIDNIVPRMLQCDSRHDFVILGQEKQLSELAVPANAVVVDNGSAVAQAAYDVVQLPRLLRRLGADLYHPLKHLGTLRPPCQQVTTAHSITLPFRGEFPVSRAEGFYWKTMGTRMFRNSAAIIAVSEFVRDFLIEIIGIAPHRISVIHHGIDPRFLRLPGAAAENSSRPEEFILTVGNIFPVKNYVVAAKVFARLARDWPNLRLKMAGATHHPYYQEVRREVESAGLLDRVDFLGFTSPDGLLRLMNDARVLLMPSLTEGCPVTLLEALACGLPTVGSARGGIPEIGGDAAILVDDPFDVDAWTSATRGLLESPERWDRHHALALQRAREFSWEAAALRTIGVYDELESNMGSAGGLRRNAGP